MNQSWRQIFHLILVGIFFGVLTGSAGTGFSSVLKKNDFAAIFISDTHISNDTTKDERLTFLVNQINSGAFSGVELLLHGGDVVASVYDEHPRKFPEKARNRLAKAVAILNKLNIPFHLAMGNHDYKIWRNRDSDAYFPQEEILQMENIWEKHTGFKPYYAVIHNGWNFIILNSMRGRYLQRHFDDEQIRFFEQELKRGLPAIVVSHFPLKTDHFRIWSWPKDLVTRTKEPSFFSLLETYQEKIKGIFVGHGHMWRDDVLFGKIPVYEVAGFGDARESVFYLITFNNANKKITVLKKEIPISSSVVETQSQRER